MVFIDSLGIVTEPSYLQHSVREIHQLPLVLSNLGHCGSLVLLQLTDVIGDNL